MKRKNPDQKSTEETPSAAPRSGLRLISVAPKQRKAEAGAEQSPTDVAHGKQTGVELATESNTPKPKSHFGSFMSAYADAIDRQVEAILGGKLD